MNETSLSPAEGWPIDFESVRRARRRTLIYRHERPEVPFPILVQKVSRDFHLTPGEEQVLLELLVGRRG